MRAHTHAHTLWFNKLTPSQQPVVPLSSRPPSPGSRGVSPFLFLEPRNLCELATEEGEHGGLGEPLCPVCRVCAPPTPKAKFSLGLIQHIQSPSAAHLSSALNVLRSTVTSTALRSVSRSARRPDCLPSPLLSSPLLTSPPSSPLPAGRPAGLPGSSSVQTTHQGTTDLTLLPDTRRAVPTLP